MKKSFSLLALISLALFGCASEKGTHKTENRAPQKSKTQTEERTKKQVVASFYPLAFIAENIVGDKAEVLNLAENTDVHEYEPSPKDMMKLNDADLVVFQGAKLEPWIEGLVPELRQKSVLTLEVTHDLELAKMEEHKDHDDDKESHEADEHEDKHEDDHGDEPENHHEDEHKEGHEEEHDEHAHGEFDPHTWLDPVLAQEMVDEILEAVVQIDSANKAFYQANAQELKHRFAKLDADFQQKLRQCSNKEFIVSHDAYGYLARRYGFEMHPITGFSPQDEPSAKIMAELKAETREGLTHILIEENNIRRFADTLAVETGLKTLPVNPLGRGTLDPQKDFFDVMEANLQSFQLALDCQQ